MTENKQSRTARRKQQKQKKKPKWKVVLLSLVFLVLLSGIVVGGVGIYWIATAPDIDPEQLSVPLSSNLLDQNGEVFATPGTENREQVNYEELPQVLIDAVIATEDARFFDHPGIDIRRIGGAILANITDGFGSQGASTITQQVVENFFLSSDKQIKLKVQEQWMALQLERQYTKQEILEMYLNKIFFGNNSFGVKAAAKSYFGVENLEDLTLPQAAILAGLPQRPTAYNPFRDPDLTAYRMNTVLTLMVRHDKISEEEAEEARQVDIPSLLVETEQEQTQYQAFIDRVDDEIREKAEGVDLYTDGLIVHTTLNRNAQDHVEFLLTDSESNPINYGEDDMQGSIVVLNTDSGAIEAIGGRRNNSPGKNFNYAIDGNFQPGSTIKPILAYGPAIEYNDMSTYHQIHDDGPFPIAGTDRYVNNIFDRNYGWVTARTALSRSLNVPAVKIFDELGYNTGWEFATQLGLTAPEEPGLTDAIGGSSSQVSPLEMANAFRPFGNGGEYSEPFAVTMIEFPDGSSLDLTPESERVMKDSTAYMVTDMLKSVITDGTWAIDGFGNLPVAGKTGTTNLTDGSAGDRWFTGYTTNYTIATWVGDLLNEDGTQRIGLPDTVHHTVAQQMFRETMVEISEGIETADFSRPDSVVEARIELGTNPPELASEFTPSSQTVTELFVRGTEPTTVSEEFDELDPVNGLNATYNENENSITVEWNYGDREVTFDVSASVDGGSMQELSSTGDMSIEISEVEAGAEYTIQVIAVDADNSSLTSEPQTTSITIPEEEDEEEETEDIPAVTNLSAEYIEADSMIDVTWNYDGPEARFDVTVNDQTQTVQSQGIEITGNFSPGTTYTINVVAIGADNDARGPSQSISVNIPESEEPEEEPEDEPEEDDDAEDPEEEEEPEDEDE